MMKYCLVFFAVLALIQGKALNARDSIKLQLYYESFCPGCTEFISGDFHDTYQAVGSSRIKLELIPVGKQTVLANGTVEFKCQHGPQECYGNKVHSCALAQHPIEIAEAYIHCLEKTGGSANVTLMQQCAKDVNISGKDIEDCMSSGQADELFAANIKKTEAAGFHLKFVPTVVVDEKYNEEEALAAVEGDFRAYVCEKLGGHPDGCEEK